MAKIGFWQSSKGAAFGSKAEALLLLKNYEDSSQGWFWATDKNGCLTYLTDRVAPMLSDEPDNMAGLTFSDLFMPASESGESTRTLPFILAKRSKFEKLTLRAMISGDARWWSISGNPQLDAAGNFAGYRGSGVDITEQRKSSEHASKLAMYDSLTGLPNRLRMTEILEASLVALEFQKRPCAIMLIDLDRFKQVNDTLGHPAGDALLKQVADRLLRIVGDGERVFRLSGDEFQVIVRNCEDLGVLGKLGNEIIASLSQPYSINGSRCIIGASVGIAISPIDGRTCDDLIRNADLALYAAKDSGRGRFRFFSNELLKAAEDRRVLEDDLRDALANGEIKLFYQPVVDAKTNRITGVEALVRWHHPQRGSISPALFIPIAEETDLIERLGEWVLRKACEDAAKWPGKLRVAVNVSPVQFNNEALPGIVLSALASSGLAPAQLELEITEGVFLGESDTTDTMFGKLKDIGVRLALDDFGTGYSSLSYLKTAPFDKIKIDQSFVRAATLPRSRNRAIIAAIVALAEALEMETTAEGIESHDQLELMRHLRVSHVQGFIYSQAVSFEEICVRMERGEWEMEPIGPDKQRSPRHSMYRTVGAIFGNYYKSVLIRNLSASGALIEGLIDVPPGSLLLIDFGEGHLAFATVRRSRKRHCGIEFEQPLVSDGNGGLTPSHRVSPYLLSSAGLPSLHAPGKVPVTDYNDAAELENIRAKLGLRSPGPVAHPGVSEVTGNGEPAAVEPRLPPTIFQLSDRYLDQIRNDPARHSLHSRYLKEDILPRFGRLRPDELTPSQICKWLTIKANEDGCPPDKINQLQGILGQMYVLAMQWGMPGMAGGGALQGLSVFNRGEGERCLSPEEVERLHQATLASHNPQLKYIVALLMLTGTRQRELFEAQWDDIDLDEGVWRIPTSDPAKKRTVSLSSAAMDAIRALPRWEQCPHVIVNPKTRKPYRSFFSSWDTARRKAGLSDVEIDDLRHSASNDVTICGAFEGLGIVSRR
ncbi:MAG: diguanylate phosphodiesterase [Sphingomonadales bacterium]|nr:diguanylate phosphodiesterase [Sphingomonadales bacterium]